MRISYIPSAIASILFLAALGFSHPLGNFSINQYSKLEVGKGDIRIRQVLDLAEIPTFQALSEIDSDKDGNISETELDIFADKLTPDYISRLTLSINGEILSIQQISKEIQLENGAGNLKTLRIEWDFRANWASAAAQNKIIFTNSNYPDRLGWRELVVSRRTGDEIYDSTAYGSGVTDQIRSYPEETLASPLNERSAEFSFSTSAIPPNASALQNRDGHVTGSVQKDRLAELIAVPDITPTVALFGLLIAFGLGAFHAMSPGHGKTVVGAYLVGSKGTTKHAIFLGMAVTITHTLGVFALGLVTLFASNYILPEKLIPFLSFVSGAIVLYIGLTMFKSRILTFFGAAVDHQHHDGHTHSHDGHTHHSHEHTAGSHTHDGSTHSHDIPEDISWKSLAALGISGGLLPCPSALVLMLSAISLNRVGYGLVLTLVFSLGLAATLIAVGVVFLYVGKFFDSPTLSENRIVRSIPIFSSFVIACLGAFICYTALGN